jgi:hypothetical protein
MGEATLELTGSIGGVAIDNPSLGTCWGRLALVFASSVVTGRLVTGHLVTLEQVGDQLFGDAGVPGVARAHHRCGDDLGVRVDGDMGLKEVRVIQ